MCRPLHSLLSFLFILLGTIEAIWGLGQLYGVVLSHHSQYLLTGSFYNPGQYSGFLAMIFPIAFVLFRIKVKDFWE